MKIVVDRSELQKCVGIVSNAVSVKSAMPILSNILVEAKDKEKKLRLAATDLDVGVEYEIPAEVNEKGGITLPAKKLSDIVRELPDAPVIISTEDTIAKIECEKTVFTLSGMPKEDFPVLPVFPKTGAFELPQKIWKSMVRKTSFAVSLEEMRQVLNGLYFWAKGNEVRMVATDGRRLAYIKGNVEDKIKDEIGVIIPIKAINELQTILGEEGNITIASTGTQIFFKTENSLVTSRLIDGQFPNYEQVIPKFCEKKIGMKSTRLLQAIRRVSVLASEKTNQIKFTIQPNCIQVSANTPEIGEAKDEFNVTYDGEEVQIAFNGKYLIDILKNIDAEEMSLEINQPLTPGVIKPVGDDNYINVIMPIKIT
ncbi:MAG: DNA polymerase III subunit beta [bacterium]|nr:DNA polymerase III subunit beta [bacterium]